MTQEKLVFPGEEIAIAEEFLPGEGTYEEDGRVYAARIGRVTLDSGEFMARVDATTNVPVVLEPGDVVLGRVSRVRENFVGIDVERAVRNPNRNVSGDTDGTLHISNVANFYVEELEDAFQVGDVVRAGVLEVDPAIDLTTKDERLGVVRRKCPRCRTPMDRKGKGVLCPACEWKATAKLAVDYGKGLLVPMEED